MTKLNKLLLFLIFILAITIRVWFVSNNSVMIWFDQSRDLITSNQIINGDFKIFGPSASGTNDTFFHGVLWYYLLAFIQLISKNPQNINIILGIIFATAIFPAYYLSLQISKNKKVAFLTAFLIAISPSHVLGSTWLSNPIISSITLILFFLFLFKYFEKHNRIDLILTFFFLGLSTQSAIFFVFWILSVFWIFLITLKQNKFYYKDWIAGIIIYTITISSMIISELLMIQRGILTRSTITSFNSGSLSTAFESFTGICELFINKISISFLPIFGSFSLIIFVISLLYIKKKIKKKSYTFLKVLLITPIIFLSIYFRTSPHILIAYEVIIFIVISQALVSSTNDLRTKVSNILLFLFISFMLLANISYLSSIKRSKDLETGIQKGALLIDQLELIKATYDISENEPFSFSSLTNPYGVNTTWAYLYDNSNKPENIPCFDGPDQTGWFGENLITNCKNTKKKPHFLIIEPDNGIHPKTYNDFIRDQHQKYSSPSAELLFGTIKLEVFN